MLLPLLTSTVGVTDAVPLLTVAQLMGNLSRAAFGFKEIRWRPVLIFLAAALPFAALGALSFVSLPKSLIVRVMGMAILAFVMMKALGWTTFAPSNRLLVFGGAAVGLLSGLVGSAGPLGAAVFLTLNLPPAAYIASEAVTAIGMHATKTIIYGSELRLSASFWPLAGALGIAMILGTWVSKSLVERVPTTWFRRFVTVLLVIAAVQMIWQG